MDKKVLEHIAKDLYINRKRELEFCNFMRLDKEKEAMENGINYLNMNNLTGVEFYKASEFGLYLLSTPNRKIITKYLALKARDMSYIKSTVLFKKKRILKYI